MFSLNVSELKGKKKFSVISCTEALGLWWDSPRLSYDAEEDRADWRGNPVCQGASRLSESQDLCQQDCHQSVWSDAISVIVLGSSGAHNFVRRGGLWHDHGPPCSFSTVPGSIAPQCWVNFAYPSHRSRAPTASAILPFFPLSWSFIWKWFYATVFINYAVVQRANKSRRDLLNSFFVFLLRKNNFQQNIKDCCARLDCFAMPGLSWCQEQMTTAILKSSSLLEKDLRLAIQLQYYLIWLSD